MAKVGDKEYLCGQEEITQNLKEKAIQELFFANREEIRVYITNGRHSLIPPAKILPNVNERLLKKINDIDRMNQEEPRDKSFIVFGPGSQFSSVFVHLKIPGVIRALAKAIHTPRVLVLNPIKDYETSGIEDKEYFNRIIKTVEGWIKDEIGRRHFRDF